MKALALAHLTFTSHWHITSSHGSMGMRNLKPQANFKLNFKLKPATLRLALAQPLPVAGSHGVCGCGTASATGSAVTQHSG